MLLITCKIKEPCAKGDDLAELVQVDTKLVDMSTGKKERRPVWGSPYMTGLPLGENTATCTCPIDLKTGDIVRVNAEIFETTNDDETVSKYRKVFDVKRKTEIVWRDEEENAKQNVRTEERLARIAEHLATERALRK